MAMNVYVSSSLSSKPNRLLTQETHKGEQDETASSFSSFLSFSFK
jgi:hypothetical protein